ncbi:MAG: endonuclease/exonuclease/phosphatase family protein [Flavobacterium sp.]
MKQAFIVAILLFFITLHSQTVKVMTYNIRLDLASDGDNRWDNRREMLAGQIQFYEPDFLGVQEALPNQMEYLQANLKDYSYIGEGRDGNGMGEHSSIFYNKLKYNVLQQNTFWLSPTPGKVSKGWDAAYNRIFTYGLFEDVKSKKKVWVFNTHFDHVGDTARMESAKLIISKIHEINIENYPVILTGDFNLEHNSESISFISSQLNDSQKVADMTFGPAGTFNAFEFTKPVTKRIDYIFTSQKIRVKKYAVLSNSDHCHYPSDHLPVFVELILK